MWRWGAPSRSVLESRPERWPAAGGDGLRGDVIGRAALCFTTTMHSTEITLGTAGTPADTIPMASTAATIRTAAIMLRTDTILTATPTLSTRTSSTGM